MSTEVARVWSIDPKDLAKLRTNFVEEVVNQGEAFNPRLTAILEQWVLCSNSGMI